MVVSCETDRWQFTAMWLHMVGSVRRLIRAPSLLAIFGVLLLGAAARGERSGGSGLVLRSNLVTSDNGLQGGGHIASAGQLIDLPGMPAPFNADGVVSLVDDAAGIFCSGALIADHYVLTSAHCVEVASIYQADSVSFDTPSGLVYRSISDVFVHPLYDGSLESGYDIAVVQLAMDAPQDAPRYGLCTSGNEIGQLTVKAGYGRTGHGSTGAISRDGLRRVGLNMYDATSVEFNSAFGMAMASNAYLMYDFDSGLTANNAWEENGVASDLGYGIDEVNGVSGDSGGPTLIYDGSQWLIAGVTSWGVGMQSDPPDVTPNITDGSWGEISADARVSVYADFVQSVVDGTYVRPIQSTFSQGVVDAAQSWVPPNIGEEIVSDESARYHTVTFVVGSDGAYSFDSSQNFDGVVYLYSGGFDPTNPEAGLIAANDNGPEENGLNSRIDPLELSANQIYTVVTSAKGTEMQGTFLNTITGPGVATASTSNGGFASAFSPEAWQFDSPHADGAFQSDTAPSSITLYGGNDNQAGITSLTIVPDTDVILEFDWTYFSIDEPAFDVLSVLVNGEVTRLTDGIDLFGQHQVVLEANDQFSIQIETFDGVNGAGIASIYDFIARLPGDYNSDGTVDLADYTVWRNNLGAPAGTLPNDTAEGTIDADQYLAWKRNFGATLPSPSSIGSATVPEPSACILLTLFAMAMTCRRRISTN